MEEILHEQAMSVQPLFKFLWTYEDSGHISVKLSPPFTLHQCTKFHCERTHHKQVIGTDTVYKFLLPEAVCCCY